MSGRKTPSRVKLMEKAIKRFEAPDPSGRQRLYWDSELIGFGVLVSGRTTAKTYVVQRKLPNRKTRRVTVGPVNVFDLDDARRLAEDQLRELHRGVDPKAKRSGAKLTLRGALDAYLAARVDLRPRSAREYRGGVERRFADWLDRPPDRGDAGADRGAPPHDPARGRRARGRARPRGPAQGPRGTRTSIGPSTPAGSSSRATRPPTTPCGRSARSGTSSASARTPGRRIPSA